MILLEALFSTCSSLPINNKAFHPRVQQYLSVWETKIISQVVSEAWLYWRFRLWVVSTNICILYLSIIIKIFCLHCLKIWHNLKPKNLRNIPIRNNHNLPWYNHGCCHGYWISYFYFLIFNFKKLIFDSGVIIEDF